MENGVEEHGILVGLDEWFDTRLATLSVLEADGRLPRGTAGLMLSTGYWATRMHDDVPIEDVGMFKEAYAQRDRRTLQFAVPTMVREAVMEFAEITYSRFSSSPVQGRPILYFNVWPYTFLVESELDVIKKGVIAATNRVMEVRMVCLSPSELGCQWLRDNISIYMCYHYTDWLSANLERALTSKNTPTAAGVGMVSPGISQGEAFTDRRDLGRCLLSIADMARPVIGLDFAPVQNFSIPVLPR